MHKNYQASLFTCKMLRARHTKYGVVLVDNCLKLRSQMRHLPESVCSFCDSCHGHRFERKINSLPVRWRLISLKQLATKRREYEFPTSISLLEYFKYQVGSCLFCKHSSVLPTQFLFSVWQSCHTAETNAFSFGGKRVSLSRLKKKMQKRFCLNTTVTTGHE